MIFRGEGEEGRKKSFCGTSWESCPRKYVELSTDIGQGQWIIRSPLKRGQIYDLLDSCILSFLSLTVPLSFATFVPLDSPFLFAKFSLVRSSDYR